MKLVFDEDGEQFVFENDWDTVIPVSFETIGGESEITVFPSVARAVEDALRPHFDDLYSDEALSSLFAALLPYMETWGYADDRFRDRWGYVLRGGAPTADFSHAGRLTPEDESRNDTTYDIRESLLDGRWVYGVLEKGRVVSLAVTHTPVTEETRRVEVGVETVPASRGKGYAKESLAALMAALSARGIEVEYRCQRYNHASRAVARSAGLSEVGKFYYYVGRKKYGI